MAYNQEHMFMQWIAYFRLGNSNTGAILEQVVGGLRWAGPGLADVDNDDTMNAAMAVLENYWQDPLARIPGPCYLTTLKWNRIGTDGRYASSAETRQVDIPGTAGTTIMRFPTQIAWATTWTTGRSRGRAHAGRTYWPTGNSLFENTSQFSNPQCQEKADRDWLLIQELTDAIRPNGNNGVSAMVMSNLGAGTSAVITGCKVGSRPDVQRRRARSIAEGYAVSPQLPD